MGNYRKYVPIILAIFVLVGCAGIQESLKGTDSAKLSLYSLKEGWIKVRYNVIREHEKGLLSDAEYKNFQETDKQFSEVYNVARNLASDSTQYDVNMQILNNMLRDARRKYLPEGV